MQHDGVTAVALMTLAAFAVERVTSGFMFLLSFSGGWRRWLGGPNNGEVEKRQKLVYFVLAGTLVLIVLLISPEMRVLTVLNIPAATGLDIGLTWLVLVAGSDRVGQLVKGGSAVPAASSKPVEIKGTLRLLEDKPDAA